MELIKKRQIKEEITKIENSIGGYKIITPRIKNRLKNLGFEKTCLGTGNSSFSSSGLIGQWFLNNSYLKGRFLGVGIAAVAAGRGNLYYAYIKEIEEEVEIQRTKGGELSFKKTLLKKWTIENSLNNKRILNCQKGFRLFEISVHLEDVPYKWVHEFLNIFEPLGVHLYEGSLDDTGFQICVPEKNIQDFLKNYKEVKYQLLQKLNNYYYHPYNKKLLYEQIELLVEGEKK